MREIQIIPGKHTCNKRMEMRVLKIPHKDTHYWIIYGICKSCDVVVCTNLLDCENEPRDGIDYFIDINECVKISEGGKNGRHK